MEATGGIILFHFPDSCVFDALAVNFQNRSENHDHVTPLSGPT